MPLEVPPPRSTRFGSPLVLSRVHWVRPELVAEVKYLTWTGDNLLRQVVYEGLREDKPAAEVRREVASQSRTDRHSRCRPGKARQQTQTEIPNRHRIPFSGIVHVDIVSRVLSVGGAPAQVFRALRRPSSASQTPDPVMFHLHNVPEESRSTLPGSLEWYVLRLLPRVRVTQDVRSNRPIASRVCGYSPYRKDEAL